MYRERWKRRRHPLKTLAASEAPQPPRKCEDCADGPEASQYPLKASERSTASIETVGYLGGVARQRHGSVQS